MTTRENPPQPVPLDSLFPELRGLSPLPPRREMLPGLEWKAIFRGPLLSLWPILVIFTFFPIVILSTIAQNKIPRQSVLARVVQVERFNQKQTFVKYRFAAGGQTYTGASVGFGNSLLSTLQPGSTLQVQFEKSQPQNSAPAFEMASQENFPLPLLFFFPLMAAFFFAPLFFPQLRTVILARKLFRRGTVTQGKLRFARVTPMQAPMAPGGGSQLIYEFLDSTGAIQNGAMKCDNAWLVNQFHVDSLVVVAYDAAKPARSVLLEPFVA